jgi:hypothetical protein
VKVFIMRISPKGGLRISVRTTRGSLPFTAVENLCRNAHNRL